jgi:DHA1 family bicyclomycin/chloramphenicol resistance-like MFS transporter
MTSNREQPGTLFIAWVIGTASIGTNAAIPTADRIEAELNLGAGAGAQIVGAFALGYAIGHLLIGVIADRSDQKRLLSLSIAGFIGASIAASFTDSQAGLLIARFAQGLFASGGPIVGRTVVRAIGQYEDAARKMSATSALFTWAPVLAPMLAGALLMRFDWQSVYLALALYGLLGLILTLRAPGAWFPQKQGTATSTAAIAHDLASLFRNDAFLRALVTTVFTFGAFLACLAAASEIVVDVSSAGLSLTALVASIAAAYAVGSGLSRILLSRLESARVLGWSVVASVLIGPLMLATHFVSNHPQSMQSLCIAYGLCAGMILPNATVLAMRDYPDASAMAAALLGGAKMLAASVASGILVLLSASTAATLGALVTVCSLVALAGLRYTGTNRVD